MKILKIFNKDVRQGIRNSQVLTALLLPLGLGLLYNVVFPDTTALPKVTVAYTVQGSSALPGIVRSVTHQTANVTFQRQGTPAQVRARVTAEKADLGLILPPSFDAQVKSGLAPQLTVVTRRASTASADYAAAALEPALRQMAGQAAPAVVTREVVPARNQSLSAVISDLGMRPYFIVVAIIILVGMISLYAVPVLLTEETEKRTLDALALIASYRDVIGAKALVGLLYIAVGVPLILVLTRLMPVNLLLFAGAIALFSVSMVGMGLLFGGLFRTTAQLNTWSSFLLLPIIFAATLQGLAVPRALDVFFAIMPSSHTLKLAIDGLSGKTYYGDTLLSLLVIAAWGLAAYAALLWRLQHRQA